MREGSALSLAQVVRAPAAPQIPAAAPRNFVATAGYAMLIAQKSSTDKKTAISLQRHERNSTSWTVNMSIMTDTQVPEELMARFEELGALEAEFEDVEVEISKLFSPVGSMGNHRISI